MRRLTPTCVTGPLVCALSFVMVSGCVRPLPSRLEAPGTISVCDLSRNFAAYAGQVLRARGVYYRGLEERCPQVCPGGQPWPSVLDLVESRSSRQNGIKVPFETDLASWDSLDRAVLRAAAANEKAEVWATVEGYLAVRANSSLGPCDLVANGMIGGLQARGWHGGYLVVKRVSGIEIRNHAPAGYDYRVFRRKPRAE
jgi:hypothetical protein